MNVLCLAPAPESQRFVRGYPPKGARLFMRPNPEISRLAGLVAKTDRFLCKDQRIEPLQWTETEDFCLLHSDFGKENPTREVAEALEHSGMPYLLFGPLATALDSRPPAWAGHRVVGDVLNIWPEIRRDALERRLKPIYRAPQQPGYVPARYVLGQWPEMNMKHQVMNFVRGCCCPDLTRRFCPEFLYYGTTRMARDRDEIIGEVLEMTGKHIELLDDDVACNHEYYSDVFGHLWDYRRHWTVSAGKELFSHPKFIRLLAKAGTKTVFMNETFLLEHLEEALHSERLVKMLYRRVKYLQSRKLLVGAKVVLRMDPDRPPDFNQVARVLARIDIDFIETVFLVPARPGEWEPTQVCYHPSVTQQEPAWVKNQFYAMGSILNRLARRPRRVGFYTTGRYLLPHSMAYRQNFLEGISAP